MPIDELIRAAEKELDRDIATAKVNPNNKPPKPPKTRFDSRQYER